MRVLRRLVKTPEEIGVEICKEGSDILTSLSVMLNTIKMRLMMMMMNRSKDD